MRKLWAVLMVLGFSVAQAPQGEDLLRLNEGQNTVVVGAFQGGRWLRAENLTRLEARRYQVFGPAGRINQAQGAGGLKTPEICDWNRETPLTLLERRAVQYPAYALSASWNPQPRAVQAISPTPAHRQAVVAELLQSIDREQLLMLEPANVAWFCGAPLARGILDPVEQPAIVVSPSRATGPACRAGRRRHAARTPPPPPRRSRRASP